MLCCHVTTKTLSSFIWLPLRQCITPMTPTKLHFTPQQPLDILLQDKCQDNVKRLRNKASIFEAHIIFSFYVEFTLILNLRWISDEHVLDVLMSYLTIYIFVISTFLMLRYQLQNIVCSNKILDEELTHLKCSLIKMAYKLH